MEKEIKKILYKVLPFVLCLCIVSGAAAPAYAAPTNIDQWAQYDGSGWSYNSSSGTFSWNLNMANSSEFVILSYLRDLYSSVKTYNDNLKSGWLFTSTGYSYPSGWSGSFYKVVLDMINSVNTSLNNNFYSNLQSYSSYPLYTYKAFIDSNLYSQQSFSSGNFILNFFSGIASLNNNVAYIANQLYADNASGSYNARSLLNQALHKYVDSSQADYSTILNNIKTNTDNLSGIKTDTANLSGIKTDTANLSGIKIDTGISSEQLTTQTAIISSHTPLISNISNNTDNIYGLLNNYPISTYVVRRPWVGSSSGELTNITSRMFASSYKYSSEPGTFRFHIANGGTSVFDVMSINLAYLLSQIFTVDGSYFARKYDVNNNSLINVRNGNDFVFSSSIADFLWRFDETLVLPLNKLQYLLADDNSVTAKKNNSSQETAVLNNFTGSGEASASVSDFGAVKDSIVDLKAGFTGGASSSDTFSFMSGDSNAWDWFTQDTANDVDRTQRSNNRLLRNSYDVASDTPLLDSYYNYILSILGGDE